VGDAVLVTGVSGFIAKHVALALLQRGHDVRGSVRSETRAEEVRAVIAEHGVDVGRLSFVVADLGSDAGWADAARGCRFVQHIASPFPMAQPKDREALVPLARQGALRVLEAALEAGVERIVMTSSVAAMMYRSGRSDVIRPTEADWSDPDWNAASAYIVSKTRAERAAWDLMTERGAREKLVVVNPGLVLGPLLDRTSGTSVDVIKLTLQGKYPAVPPSAYAVVDVRDVADLHVAAMTAEVGGRRLIAAGETRTMKDMARILREAFPDRAGKIPTHEIPGFVVKAMSLFDSSLKSVIPDLGTRPVVDATYVTTLTGVTFRSADEALRAAGQSLIDHGLV
jgi:nucleoside-diphosphate-sugar epimerase